MENTKSWLHTKIQATDTFLLHLRRFNSEFWEVFPQILARLRYLFGGDGCFWLLFLPIFLLHSWWRGVLLRGSDDGSSPLHGFHLRPYKPAAPIRGCGGSLRSPPKWGVMGVLRTKMG